MSISILKDSLKKLQLERYCYHHAETVLSFDGETIAPRASAPGRGEAMAFLAQKQHELLTSNETSDLLAQLWERRGELDAETARQVELLREETDELTRIPKEEYAQYSRLINDSISAWVQAKQEDDYALFEPYLKQVIDFSCRFARYHRADLPVYDSMLDTYEKGMSCAQLDPFFAMLRAEIVPLMEKAGELPPVPEFASRHFSIDRQREFSDFLMQTIGLDRSRCAISETEHPFTTSTSCNDVRITTHYYPNAFLSSLYSVIHEGGHAHYELGLPEKWQYTALSDVPSLGLHESQSRFYENLIGHSEGFLSHIAPRLREFFPEVMHDVSDRELFLAANHVRPSLIRTEADQVTYPLHIMIRYELEKQLVSGSLSTADLPGAWNALYREYLGVDVPSNRMGVLQDTHWAGGMFGYFPTYALGSAYASQFLHAMEKELDVKALVARGEIAPITRWLNEHIHCHAHLYSPADLLQKASGEAFNPSYYVEHLRSALEGVLKNC